MVASSGRWGDELPCECWHKVDERLAVYQENLAKRNSVNHRPYGLWENVYVFVDDIFNGRAV